MTGVSIRARQGRRAVRSARLAAASTDASARAPAVEFIDEAFAGFAPPAPHVLPQRLIADLSSQLEALDREREQLSKLLRSIDAASISR